MAAAQVTRFRRDSTFVANKGIGTNSAIAIIGTPRLWSDAVTEPPIGAVVKFAGQHRDFSGRPSPVRYEYAAIRANNGRWYTTGSSCPPQGFDYAGLNRFLSTLIDPTGVRLA